MRTVCIMIEETGVVETGDVGAGEFLFTVNHSAKTRRVVARFGFFRISKGLIEGG
jgi:hypothetical protein